MKRPRYRMWLYLIKLWVHKYIQTLEVEFPNMYVTLVGSLNDDFIVVVS